MPPTVGMDFSRAALFPAFCVALSSVTVFDALLEEYVQWVERITDEDVGATRGGNGFFGSCVVSFILCGTVIRDSV